MGVRTDFTYFHHQIYHKSAKESLNAAICRSQLMGALDYPSCTDITRTRRKQGAYFSIFCPLEPISHSQTSSFVQSFRYWHRASYLAQVDLKLLVIMAAFPAQPKIQLTSMSQLALVGQANFLKGPDHANFVKAVDKEDDWTGLTDATARRKRQNRLNVRAYRK
jgi:hypothetical protein